MVFYETMRLFPSAWILHRKVKKDVIIVNINLSENTDVYIPIKSFHRSSVFYDDPYSFDPSRFIKKSIDPWAYLPFGRGMYACPGLHTGIFLAEQFVFDLVNEEVRISSIRKEQNELDSIPISLNPFQSFAFLAISHIKLALSIRTLHHLPLSIRLVYSLLKTPHFLIPLHDESIARNLITVELQKVAEELGIVLTVEMLNNQVQKIMSSTA